MKQEEREEKRCWSSFIDFITKMKTSFSPKNNPRVIIIQKLYGKFFNNDEKIEFPKHRFKKFIKIPGLLNNEILVEELYKNLGDEFNLII